MMSHYVNNEILVSTRHYQTYRYDIVRTGLPRRRGCAFTACGGEQAWLRIHCMRR